MEHSTSVIQSLLWTRTEEWYRASYCSYSFLSILIVVCISSRESVWKIAPNIADMLVLFGILVSATGSVFGSQLLLCAVYMFWHDLHKFQIWPLYKLWRWISWIELSTGAIEAFVRLWRTPAHITIFRYKKCVPTLFYAFLIFNRLLECVNTGQRRKIKQVVPRLFFFRVWVEGLIKNSSVLTYL